MTTDLRHPARLEKKKNMRRTLPGGAERARQPHSHSHLGFPAKGEVHNFFPALPLGLKLAEQWAHGEYVLGCSHDAPSVCCGPLRP